MTFEYNCQRISGYIFLAYSVLYTLTNGVLLIYKNSKETLTEEQQIYYILDYIVFGILFLWSSVMALDHYCGTYSFTKEGYEKLETEYGDHRLPGLQKCLHTKTSCCSHYGHTMINLCFTTIALVVTLLLFFAGSGWVEDVVLTTTILGFIGNVYDTIIVCTDDKSKKSGSSVN